jgi:hypothetical protein
MKFATVALAAVIVAGAAFSSTAKAELYWGPERVGNQCWNKAVHANNGYGFWTPCKAAAPAGRVAHHAKHS